VPAQRGVSFVGDIQLAYGDNAKIWDLGKVMPNQHLMARISHLASEGASDEGDEEVQGRTELDSHANMVCLGRNALVLEETRCLF